MDYPKEIYVQVEENGDDSFLLAQEEVVDSNDGEVAVYQLAKVVNKSTKTVLEDVN